MTKHKIYGKVARTRSEIKKGLMFRKTLLKQQEGLLFDMETNKIQGFWMKNTFIPLDVIFLNSNFRVLGVVENTVPHSLENVKINKKSSYVIEVNAGETRRMDIRTNDYIDFYEYI